MRLYQCWSQSLRGVNATKQSMYSYNISSSNFGWVKKIHGLLRLLRYASGPRNDDTLGYSSLLVSLILTTFFPASLHAQLVPTSKNQANIKILSEQLDCDQSKNICIAKGNAVAEKLNEPKKKILKADEITAYFSKEGGAGPQKVTRLEAAGNVFFIIGDIIVQGRRGTYDVVPETAEVFEDVKVTNGQNQLDGSYGKVNMKTGRYFISHGKERVQALILSKETKETVHDK